MKPSRYNRVFQATDGTWLAFNAWTTALAEIEPADEAFVRSLLAAPEETPCTTPHQRSIKEALFQARFLVPDEEDEVATARVDLQRDRFRTDRLDLTIAPTLDCNFRCDYCYEEHLKVSMSGTVRDALMAWVEERARTIDTLNVTWYGGEPLLPRAYPVVEQLSQRFLELSERRGLAYVASLVTNGFFLDRPKMEALAANGVQRVQVTLDGPPEAHDARRHLIGGRGTFARILENLKETVDLAEFQIRINVDARNAMSALEVLEILAEAGLGAKVRTYLAAVTHDGAACGNIQELCYSNESFARAEVEIYREAARRGLPLSKYPFRIAGAFCTAEKVNGYVVAPNGLLFKCWHEVTMSPEHSIGSLLDGQQPYQRVTENRWLSWDVLSTKKGCQTCSVMPLCHGGCPVEAMKTPDSDRGACEPYKFHLEPLLELRHQQPAEDAGAGFARAGQDVACR